MANQQLRADLFRSDPYERTTEIQPTLSDEAIERLKAYGSIESVNEGDVLFDIGDNQTQFVVVLSGVLRIEVDDCNETTTIVDHKRGAFFG